MVAKQWFNFYSHLLYLIIDQTFTLAVFINDHHIVTKFFFFFFAVLFIFYFNYFIYPYQSGSLIKACL